MVPRRAQVKNGQKSWSLREYKTIFFDMSLYLNRKLRF